MTAAAAFRVAHRCVVAMGMLAGAAQELNAQVVRGRVAVMGADTVPVRGAIVQLVDSAGRVNGSVLSSAGGTFVLPRPATGAYRLRALRIGYRPSLGAAITGDVASIDVGYFPLVSKVVQLAAAEVVASSSCAAAGDTASAAFRVWEEVRKALQASLLTRQSRQYEMSVVRRAQQIRISDDSLLFDDEVEERTSAPRPFTAVDPALLLRLGYIFPDSTSASGLLTYAAPDERVLLSEEFAMTHCFSIAATSPREVRLAFRPVPERRLPDVEGEIAVDRRTSELRLLSFRFVNRPTTASYPATGELEFRSLSGGGGWFVTRWHLDLPLAARTIRSVMDGGASVRTVETRRVMVDTLVARQRDGGEVWAIRTGTSVLWRGDAISVSGTVKDSSGHPLSRSLVRVLESGEETRTDSVGTYALREIRPGLRRFSVVTPESDAMGAAGIITRVRVDRPTSALRLLGPTSEQVLEAACPDDHPLPASFGAIRGTVRTADGSIAPSVSIVASWVERAPGGAEQERRLRRRSSYVGSFLICGPRRGTRIRLAARTSDGQSADIELLMPSSGILRRDVVLGGDPVR